MIAKRLVPITSRIVVTGWSSFHSPFVKIVTGYQVQPVLRKTLLCSSLLLSRTFSEHFAAISDDDQKSQCRKWFEIVQYGTAAELHEAIEDGGVDVNCRNEDDKTLLIVAAELGKVEIMKVLISNGANINLQDKFGDTAMIAASRENCKNAVKVLVEAGAQADVINYEQMTAADTTLDVEIDETLREKDGHVKETHADDGCCVR